MTNILPGCHAVYYNKPISLELICYGFGFLDFMIGTISSKGLFVPFFLIMNS